MKNLSWESYWLCEIFMWVCEGILVGLVSHENCCWYNYSYQCFVNCLLVHIFVSIFPKQLPEIFQDIAVFRCARSNLFYLILIGNLLLGFGNVSRIYSANFLFITKFIDLNWRNLVSFRYIWLSVSLYKKTYRLTDGRDTKSVAFLLIDLLSIDPYLCFYAKGTTSCFSSQYKRFIVSDGNSAKSSKILLEMRNSISYQNILVFKSVVFGFFICFFFFGFSSFWAIWKFPLWSWMSETTDMK